jgi:hypothetical protein
MTADNRDNFAVVRMAARNARRVVDKYYAKTDESIVYRVAMCKSRLRSIPF